MRIMTASSDGRRDTNVIITIKLGSQLQRKHLCQGNRKRKNRCHMRSGIVNGETKVVECRFTNLLSNLAWSGPSNILPTMANSSEQDKERQATHTLKQNCTIKGGGAGGPSHYRHPRSPRLSEPHLRQLLIAVVDPDSCPSVTCVHEPVPADSESSEAEVDNAEFLIGQRQAVGSIVNCHNRGRFAFPVHDA